VLFVCDSKSELTLSGVFAWICPDEESVPAWRPLAGLIRSLSTLSLRV
jgi:hypothetical protein